MLTNTETIMAVDDNEDDLFALQRALKKSGITNPLQILHNGQQAIDYLAGEGPYADRGAFPVPRLMFLDLKMPLRDGFEVLTWLRERPELAGVAVVVLSGSDEARDHQRAYALGARSYLVKPARAPDIQAIMESLRSFWDRAVVSGEARPVS